MPIIKLNKSADFTIKKSKFLSFAFLVKSEAEISKILADIKKEHPKARHIVYAYRLQENNQLKERFHNDREPSQSAGLPLYNLLKNQDIVNCLVVVVRYYGGIKLGVGGLVRAYTTSAKLVLENNLALDGN
ncbi:MAG: YigZ family protein [Patescibacteria group bacterium]